MSYVIGTYGRRHNFSTLCVLIINSTIYIWTCEKCRTIAQV
ncbi:hypothetical protein PanWU01x14_204030 [Parasponia andersonii]|uniref:Uncharacterized protein n=1 Tax=Parasponia andersonii TaxID=3476 RepID=A0A2P5BWJ7_PARAD|nr:hypothetical protein PanWU01x14_204030 [Parasponia andersonii]